MSVRECAVTLVCSLLLSVICVAAVAAPQAPFRTIAVPQLRPDPGALTFYVSPTGNDAWSGRLAEPNAGRTDGPWATIREARDRVRTLKADLGLQRPIVIMLRGGVYPQSEALVFSAEDSGSEACPITYQAYPAEIPVVTGGRALQGWELDDSEQSRLYCDGKLWRLSVPAGDDGNPWRFNQLVVNGQRRVRARIPNKGAFLRTDGPASKTSSRSFYYQEGDVQEWRNLRDVLFVVYHSWETSIHHVRRVDEEAKRVTLLEPAPWPMGQWEKQQRYYVENVFEGLDEPGEWYLDRPTHTLYYYPLPGEEPQRIRAEAPLLTSTLIRFEGAPSQNQLVEFLVFSGISFENTDPELKRIRNPGQGEINQPALIMATGLRHASIEDCEVAHAGAHGIWLGSGCEDVAVNRCHIHDLGGGGVYIGGGWGVNETAPVQRITIDNNFIHDGSATFHGAHGVWIGTSSYNAVTHNEISNFDYSGISCGWSWGFAPSTANHNNLDYNNIHHLGNGEGLSDMGGIYTLGVSPGTTERYNRIHDVYNYAYVSHGSGIYPDEGSSEILIENNVVYRIRTCPLFQHYGKDNIVRNNILAFGGQGQMQRCREDIPCHYIAEGNILYADVTQMLGGTWKSGDWKVGRNVYWSTAGEPLFADMDFATWQEKGDDVGSIVADPLFVDPEAGDFTLKPDSPALKLGFKPIDPSLTGLYGDAQWVSLPERYPNRELNEIPAPVTEPFIMNFDFDAEEEGAEPLDGTAITGSPDAPVAISADVAASGDHSLKFVDAPGQANNWTPHLCYKKNYTDGPVNLSWDMLNSKETPASFYVEIRQWDISPYAVGPTVSVASDGTVTAGRQVIGTMPLGEWVHVDITMALGEGTPKSYQLTLSVPGEDPISTIIPYFDARFASITWAGISSTSEVVSVFYIDNLKLGTAEELAQTPKRRPVTRKTRNKPRPPANADALVGEWLFDEAESYVAADSSGYQNDGDVWATRAKGEFGTAIFCDTAASNVAVLDDPALHFGTGDFSIELWLCPTQLTIATADARRRFMSKDAFPSTFWNLNVSAEGKLLLEMVDANKVGCNHKAKGTIAENEWTHLAVVVDRTHATVQFYLNGTLDSSRGIPENFTGALDVDGSDLSIGSTWQPFIGLLDDVRIYKRALQANEISARYEKQKSGRSSSAYRLTE